MSRYDWERGTITLPSAEAASFKKDVRAAANAHAEATYEKARAIWREHGAKLRRASKAGKALDLYDLVGRDYTEDVDEMVSLWLVKGKMAKPRKLTNKDNAISVGYGAAITFDGRKVTWGVSENNHAVEHARQHAIAAAFFHRLGRVKWTRGSGGEIVGNDEYNRDADYDGGGANYVTETWPKPKPTRYTGYSAYGRRPLW